MPGSKTYRMVKHYLRRLGERILQLAQKEKPERIAAACALGVFFSFSPFLGFQVLLAFSLAYLLRLNRCAVFIGLNANLPWIAVPYYIGATTLGGWLTGVEPYAGLVSRIHAVFAHSMLTVEFYRGLWGTGTDLLLALSVGSTVCSAMLVLPAYYAILALLRSASHMRVSSTPSPDASLDTDV